MSPSRRPCNHKDSCYRKEFKFAEGPVGVNSMQSVKVEPSEFLIVHANDLFSSLASQFPARAESECDNRPASVQSTTAAQRATDFVMVRDPPRAPSVLQPFHPQPVLRVQLNISELPSSFDDCPLSFLPFIVPLSRPPLPSSHSKVLEELLNFGDLNEPVVPQAQP